MSATAARPSASCSARPAQPAGSAGAPSRRARRATSRTPARSGRGVTAPGRSCSTARQTTFPRPRTPTTSTPADATSVSSGLGLPDVDHPRDAESVLAHAELVAPHLLLEGNRHAAAVGQLLEVAAQLVGVVA